MVNQEILGGLKSALDRKQSLRHGMISLYNAGYNTQEIEEAAKSLRESESIETGVQMKAQIPEKPPVKPGQMKKFSPPKKQDEVYQPPPIQTKKQQEIKPSKPQKVSDYESKKPGVDKVVIILTVILFFLLGVLATTFFFRRELADLFNSIF